jgi:hypothetical protein
MIIVALKRNFLSVNYRVYSFFSNQTMTRITNPRSYFTFLTRCFPIPLYDVDANVPILHQPSLHSTFIRGINNHSLLLYMILV